MRRLLACLLLSILFVGPCWSQSEAVNDWRRSIVARIKEGVHFPPGHAGQGGEAQIEFKLDRSGKVVSVAVRKSTGVPELDRAAIAAIENTHFPPVPPEIDDSVVGLVAPITFNSNEWRSKIREQVRAHFNVPPGLSNTYAEVSVDFTIDRSGKVLSKKLVRSTGIPQLDAAALAAVEAAQPFQVPFNVDESGVRSSVTLGLPGPTIVDIDKAEEKVRERLRGICRGC